MVESTRPLRPRPAARGLDAGADRRLAEAGGEERELRAISAGTIYTFIHRAGQKGFKQAVMAHLDALSPEAAEIGAVNTVVFAGARVRGHNTDGWSFAESFREKWPTGRATPPATST